jgi:hypothetical protein
VRLAAVGTRRSARARVGSVYSAHRAVCSASRGQIIIHTQLRYTAAAVCQPANNPNSSEVNQATGPQG